MHCVGLRAPIASDPAIGPLTRGNSLDTWLDLQVQPLLAATVCPSVTLQNRAPGPQLAARVDGACDQSEQPPIVSSAVMTG